MNRYEKYMLRQLVLNTVIPPNPNNKLFGSRAMYDFFGMWCFFNVGKKKPKRIVKPEVQPKLDMSQINEYINTKTSNPLVKIGQWYTKCVIKGIEVVTGQKLS